MPMWRCYYHVVWATKHRQPMITPSIELVIQSAIERKCLELGCTLLGLNGVSDHIHLAIIISPSYAPAHVIGQMKGATAHSVNQSFDLPDKFRWQEGYGLFSFGEQSIPQVLAYIAKQKEHHQNGTLWPYFEQMDE